MKSFTIRYNSCASLNCRQEGFSDCSNPFRNQIDKDSSGIREINIQNIRMKDLSLTSPQGSHHQKAGRRGDVKWTLSDKPSAEIFS